MSLPDYLNLVFRETASERMGLDFFPLDEMVGVDSFDRDSFTFMAVNGEDVDHVAPPSIIEEMGTSRQHTDAYPTTAGSLTTGI